MYRLKLKCNNINNINVIMLFNLHWIICILLIPDTNKWITWNMQPKVLQEISIFRFFNDIKMQCIFVKSYILQSDIVHEMIYMKKTGLKCSPSLHLDVLYPTIHPRQVPSTVSHSPSKQFWGHDKEQFSP